MRRTKRQYQEGGEHDGFGDAQPHA
jgi:hypothetical protein